MATAVPSSSRPDTKYGGNNPQYLLVSWDVALHRNCCVPFPTLLWISFHKVYGDGVFTRLIVCVCVGGGGGGGGGGGVGHPFPVGL